MKIERFRLFIVIFIFVFLFCFRPIVAFRLYTQLDDLCYATWTAKFLFLFPETCKGGSYPPGAGLMWWPAGFSTIFFSGWNIEDFFTKLPIFVGILSFIYWCLSAVLFQSFLFIFSIPVLYYATHRTTMVHAPELFLAALLILVSCRNWAWRALLVSILLVMLRLNDAPALLFPLCLFFNKWKEEGKVNKEVFKNIGLLLTIGLMAVCICYLFLKGIQGYHSTHILRLVNRVGFHRLQRVLIGSDWGLFFTGPFWIYCFSFALIHFKKLSNLAKASFLWMCFELLICISWRGNGSDFGYRYLIGSYAGVFLLWNEMKNYILWDKFSKPILWLNSVVLFWLTWIYKEFDSVTPISISGLNWTQPHLLKNAFLGLFHHEYYLNPFLHSPIAMIFYTITNPDSPYTLPIDQVRLPFWILVFILLFSILYVIYYFFIKFRKNQSAVQ